MLSSYAVYNIIVYIVKFTDLGFFVCVSKVKFMLLLTPNKYVLVNLVIAELLYKGFSILGI